MFKFGLLILFVISSVCGSGQTTKIISSYPQKVPAGKKWVFSLKSMPLVELSDASFYSGNICNALIESQPRVINYITELEITRGNFIPVRHISISFKSLTKIAFANDRTFQVSDIIEYAVFSNNDTKELKSEVVFYDGQIVAADGCIESIEVIEMPLSKTDLSKVRTGSAGAVSTEKNNDNNKVESRNTYKAVDKPKYIYGSKSNIEVKWDEFFKSFCSAIEQKNIKRVKELTVSNFFDGGGGYTLEEWLIEIVFVDVITHELFKKELQDKIIQRTLNDGSIDRVTGNGEAGHLYFIYENSEWKFGGVIGD